MKTLWQSLAILFTVFTVVMVGTRTAPCSVTAIKGDAAVKAVNAFAIDLYAKIWKPEGNLIFSPYSVSTALAMAYAGARGRTESQMAKVLHYSVEQAKVNQGFRSLNELVLSARKEKNVEINIANALWAEKSYPVRKEYLESIRFNFNTQGGFSQLPVVKQFVDVVWGNQEEGLRQLDFRHNPESSRKTINAWVERQTHYRIKDLLAPGIITALTRLVLTNAIYFKGLWESPFEKKFTKQEPFTLLDGKKVKVPMMDQTKSFGYGEEPGLQVLEMPYKGGDLAMVVFLPSKERRLAEFEDTVTVDKLGAWIDKLRDRTVHVYLPRFKMTMDCQLRTELAALGMIDAFSTNADFSGMTGKRYLFIGDVVHKAFVELNEKGTEAAAATSVLMLKGMLSPGKAPSIPVFRADRPFVFLIRHRPSRCILFLGRVTNP